MEVNNWQIPYLADCEILLGKVVLEKLKTLNGTKPDERWPITSKILYKYFTTVEKVKEHKEVNSKGKSSNFIAHSLTTGKS